MIARWIRKIPAGTLSDYYLEVDPGETTDLSAQNPDITSEMTTIINTARKEDPSWVF
jgi:hypothetical protein